MPYSPTEVESLADKASELIRSGVAFSDAIWQAVGKSGGSATFHEVQQELSRRSAAARKRKKTAKVVAPPPPKTDRKSWADGYYDN